MTGNPHFERLGGVDPFLALVASRIIQLVNAQGFTLYVTSGRRTREQQADLYAQFERGEHPGPVAKPGSSRHEWGFAFDLGGDPQGLAIAGRVAPLYGLRWGGRWDHPDVNHFEAG